ncbi:DUF1194 domain-containing protein [Limimaricola pyoseonensis]|uniref:Ca-activated chloride channel family protein n=1 Tax=Limimaricola pyoseonensis TaxID=521013 RepID=A0A1G7GTZ0_9RHOB|nr:DUF1194 domain-containing protein [Limimaricola pyoseonensis]SDE91648.1 Ca-activated chloride channel family protein [Limimaricola pyoseonensis]
MARPFALALWIASVPTAVAACDTALVLAIDVSNSVDEAEYRLQVDGLADALADPMVIEAATVGKVSMTVLQWSASSQQRVTTPWTSMQDRATLARFAAEVRATPRAFTLGGTAPAEAIEAALDLIAAGPVCHRKVIDISGDGTPNDGGDVETARRRAELEGVTVNGIAIESMGVAISQFYARRLVSRDGFVMTARAHRDYPRAIKAKLRRELVRVVGQATPP